MIPFLTVLDKCQYIASFCQYIASFWMLFSIWERPCVQKEMINYRIFMDKISGKNLLSRWPFRKWKGNNTEKTKKVTEVLRGRARTIYPNGDHCRKFDVNPVKGSKVLSGHFICAVHENQLRSSSLFSALWSIMKLSRKKYFLVLLLTLYLVTSVYIEVISKRSTERCKL